MSQRATTDAEAGSLKNAARRPIPPAAASHAAQPLLAPLSRHAHTPWAAAYSNQLHSPRRRCGTPCRTSPSLLALGTLSTIAERPTAERPMAQYESLTDVNSPFLSTRTSYYLHSLEYSVEIPLLGYRRVLSLCFVRERLDSTHLEFGPESSD